MPFEESRGDEHCECDIPFIQLFPEETWIGPTASLYVKSLYGLSHLKYCELPIRKLDFNRKSSKSLGKLEKLKKNFAAFGREKSVLR